MIVRVRDFEQKNSCHRSFDRRLGGEKKESRDVYKCRDVESYLLTILYYEVVARIMTKWTVVVVLTYDVISDIFTYYTLEVISNNYSNGVVEFKSYATAYQ